jgi:hypothetical protein
MDVDSLKAELEKHLAHNPDAQAPHGFRDRFDILAEQYKADEGDVSKSALETELQQIRNEAEAAANCAGEQPRAEPPPRVLEVEKPAPPEERVSETVDARVNPAETVNANVEPPASGFIARYGIALVTAVVVLAAAYYFFRR